MKNHENPSKSMKIHEKHKFSQKKKLEKKIIKKLRKKNRKIFGFFFGFRSISHKFACTLRPTRSAPQLAPVLLRRGPTAPPQFGTSGHLPPTPSPGRGPTSLPSPPAVSALASRLQTRSVAASRPHRRPASGLLVILLQKPQP